MNFSLDEACFIICVILILFLLFYTLFSLKN